MVATKVSETKLTKQEEAKNDQFSWGYWAEETDPAKLHGGWIESIATETSAEKIAEWKTGGFKASYNGNIIGTVRNLSGDSYKMENGTFGFDFDFGKKSVAGQMSFKANSENYDLAFLSSNSIAENGNSFSFNKTSTTSNSQEFIDSSINNKVNIFMVLVNFLVQMVKQLEAVLQLDLKMEILQLVQFMEINSNRGLY